ncbi:Protein farnesyltransferase/geranylgeranyltransferase type-1 subunit alpha [Wickerhamiella sorbophila]|uniref:Protein farnesyltransferase/geranylgeranyltransferase type-1 subunit alpha n=1 Tax=Wickerhamiella sorbophila TaxID=45607 RepID=A0A2T0FIE0_9ASCO|nr:Protein farnesyltransferase/geranylgeranyltransferase type-1 subunit alpha [Wickerhamiella sorbophila]PRT54709.1 Protein farnesyltransferase/geranylgeranyltransferase type-1 subunit alpha [Wickerhamiella sorbophila]
MSLFWEDYNWDDVQPVFEDNSSGKLAAIAYSDEYKKAMGYLRAVMGAGEHSERALALTKQIIADNAAHYSVWDYRLDIVKNIGNDVFDYRKVGLVKSHAPTIGEDGEWLNELTLDTPKNYQIWNYRQHLEIKDCPEYYNGEVVAVKFILEDDPKNFHAWSHLKWTVSSSLKNCSAPLLLEPLLEYTNQLIQEDVFNNSAWSFRYFLYQTWPVLKSAETLDKEILFVEEKIAMDPMNESPWPYLKAVCNEFSPNALSTLRSVAIKFPDNARALEAVAETSPAEEQAAYCQKLCELENFRANYWRYKFKC